MLNSLPCSETLFTCLVFWIAVVNLVLSLSHVTCQMYIHEVGSYCSGVDWKIVSRFCDVSRSYKTFQNPNDESDSGPKTWRGWCLHLLTLPAVLPKSMARVPGQLWRTISGQEKDMQLGKHAHKGHGTHITPCSSDGASKN